MGWLIEDGPEAYEHEGYVVGVVRDEWDWRELGFDDGAQALTTVQVGCQCGWRSQRMTAPIGTEWFPCMVELPTSFGDSYEDAAYEIWRHHRDAIADLVTPGGPLSSAGELFHVADDRRRRGAEPVWGG